METFTSAKALVENPNFADQRRQCLAGLTDSMIDPPIRQLIHKLNGLGCCFTLQSCYGHFLYPGQRDPHNLEPLPSTGSHPRVTYRIAYLALCINKSVQSERLLETLRRIPRLDPENIQFGSATWFWQRHVNTYVLQVEPDRFKYQDQAVVDYGEALKLSALRSLCFDRLMGSIEMMSASPGK